MELILLLLLLLLLLIIIIIIIIILTEVSFLEFILDLDKYIFPLADIFFGGGSS